MSSYRIFQLTVGDVARGTIGGYRVPAHNGPSRGHADLAVTVVAALMIMRDPETNRPGSAFGVMYSAVVSDAKLPPEYDKFVTIGGAKRFGIVGGAEDEATNGMMAYKVCAAQYQMGRHAYNGALGWPCLTGGSAAITHPDGDGVLRNCMVFFLPLRGEETALSNEPMFPANFENKLKWLHDGLKHCFETWLDSRDPAGQRPKLDLTGMALCVHDNYPAPAYDAAGKRRGHYRKPRAKGVMMLPGTVKDDGAVVNPDMFGFWTPLGHLVFLRIPLALSGDLAPPELWVTCICALDNQR